MINCEYAFHMGFDIKKMAGQNLLRILNDANISQNKLADLLGVQPPYVNAIIKGKRGIGNKIMPMLCDILKKHPADFYYEATSTIITDEEEKRIIQAIRSQPFIKHQVAAISEALSSQYKEDSKSRSSAAIQTEKKALAKRRTA